MDIEKQIKEIVNKIQSFVSINDTITNKIKEEQLLMKNLSTSQQSDKRKQVLLPLLKKVKMNENEINNLRGQLNTLIALKKSLNEQKYINERLAPNYDEEEKELEALTNEQPLSPNINNEEKQFKDIDDEPLSPNINNEEKQFKDITDEPLSPNINNEEKQFKDIADEPSNDIEEPLIAEPKISNNNNNNNNNLDIEEKDTTLKGFRETLKLTKKQNDVTKINNTQICNNILNNGIKIGRKHFIPSQFPNLTRVKKPILSGGRKTRRRKS